MSNEQELIANTNPQVKDALELDIDLAGNDVDVSWDSVVDINYRLQWTDNLMGGTWQTMYFGTALDTSSIVSDSTTGNATSRYYRGYVVP